MAAVLKTDRPDSEQLSGGIRRRCVEIRQNSGIPTRLSSVWYDRAIEVSASHCAFDKPEPEECRDTIEDADTKEEMLEVLRGVRKRHEEEKESALR